jgi:hypothetical protein
MKKFVRILTATVFVAAFTAAIGCLHVGVSANGNDNKASSDRSARKTDAESNIGANNTNTLTPKPRGSTTVTGTSSGGNKIKEKSKDSVCVEDCVKESKRQYGATCDKLHTAQERERCKAKWIAGKARHSCELKCKGPQP